MTAYDPNLALGPTYKGFSGPADAIPRRGVSPKTAAAIGAVAAIALGITAGFWAAPPKLAVYEPKPMAAVEQEVAGPQLDIDVFTPPLPPPPRARGDRLEVMSPDTVQAAQAKTVQLTSAPAPATAPVIEVASGAQIAPVRFTPPQPRPIRVNPQPLRAEPDDVVDCRNPSGREEVALCNDIGATPRHDRAERDVYADDGPRYRDDE